MAAIKAAAELMEIGEIWTVKMKRAMNHMMHLSIDAVDRESFASAVDDNWQMFKATDEDVKAIFEPHVPEPERKKTHALRVRGVPQEHLRDLLPWH